MTKRFFVAVMVCGLPTVAGAQVPQFGKTAAALRTDDLNSMSPAKRKATVEQIASARTDSGARAKILTNVLLQDPAPEVRQAAATALARLGRKARAMLAYSAVCDPDPPTRAGLAAYARHAKLACHQFTHPRTVKVRLPGDTQGLLAHLKHPLSDARLRALRLLAAQAGTPRVRSAMWAMATKDPFFAVRIDALRALAPRYGAKLGPLVRFTLSGDPDSRVREVGLEVLSYLRLGDATALAARSARAETVPKLRAAAVAALVKLDGLPGAHELAKLAVSHPDEDTRLAAVKGLLSLPKHRRYTQTVLTRVLADDRSGKVRAAAMRALAGGRSAAVCSARAKRINDPEAAVRAVVVEQLDGCPASVALPALKAAALEDRDAKVRHAALTLLCTKLAARAADVIATVLRREREVAHRRLAFTALAKLPEAQRTPLLVAVARDDADADLRSEATLALGKLPGKLAVAPLAEVLRRDAKVAVRLAAIQAIKRYPDEPAYQALRSAASTDASPEVRTAAVAAAAKSPGQRSWVSALLAKTLNPTPSVRVGAARELCALRVPRTYRALVRLLWVDPEPGVRAALARCFADIDSPLVDVALSVAHKTDADGGVVRSIEAAQRQRVERLNALLLQARAQDANQRAEAIHRLIPSPNQKVRATLEHAAVSDREVQVRRAAAGKLYRYADQRALQKLMYVSQNESDPTARSYMMRLYDDLRRRWVSAKKATGLAELVRAMSGGTLKDRVAAAETLGTLRDKRALPSLRSAAGASEPALRYAALIALATLGEAAELAKAAKAEQDKATRDRLIQVNYLLGAADAELLRAITSSNADEVRRGVEAAAIRKLPATVPHLARLALTHLDKQVRQAAAAALVVADNPLAYWTVRVASSHDASRKLRRTMWGLTVLADGGKS